MAGFGQVADNQSYLSIKGGFVDDNIFPAFPVQSLADLAEQIEKTMPSAKSLSYIGVSVDMTLEVAQDLLNAVKLYQAGYIESRITQLRAEHIENQRGQTLDVKAALNAELSGALNELYLIRKRLVSCSSKSSASDYWTQDKPSKQGVYILRSSALDRGLKVGVIMKDGKLTTTLFDDYKNQVPVSVIPESWQWQVVFLTDDQPRILHSL